MLDFNYKLMRASGFQTAINLSNEGKFNWILNEVCYFLQVKKSDVISNSRFPVFVLARKVISYILRKEFNITFKEIGIFLNRDHSNIVYLSQWVEIRLDIIHTYPEEAKLLNYITNKINHE